MTSPIDYQQLDSTLQQLEKELRRLGWWEEEPPPSPALASTQPFHADTLAFEQWLQWIFIPRIRELVTGRETLPGRCEIAPMGEVAWQTQLRKVTPLLALLRSLDRQLSLGTTARKT
jgi:uncharacterized protein YqcC (DUF446 family)